MGAAAVAAALLAAVATTAAVAANGGASTPKAAKPKAISPAAAFVLPSATACVRARKLTVRVRALRQVAWHEAIVSIDGRRFRTVTRSRITRPVRLTGLPVGRFVLSITATASDERSTTASRTYRTCAPPPPPPSHSLLVTVAGSGSGSVSGSGIGCPGSCSHSYPAGTTVTLSATPASGSSFGGWSGAGCGGTGTCAVTLSSDRSLTATFTLARGTVTGPPPAVSGVSPSSGPLAGGSSATITGTNLTGATAVKFGSTAAGFTVDSATRITATAPAGSGTVDVTVTTRGGTSATSAADRYTYLLAPTVSGVSPSSGPLAGGTSVTITGTSFVAGATVAFGADPATNVTVDSATRITATAPAGSGTVDVTVSTPGGTSAVSTADRYTYLAGATLKVNTTTDGTTAGDHLCSLREAIAAANAPGTASDCGTAGSVANTIVLGAGTYTLSIAPTGADDNASGDLNVTGATPLTIVGVGASKTVIDAAGLGDRVLSVGAGATVTLQDLEISGGQAPAGAAGASPGVGGGRPGGSGSDGGGISNAGNLSLLRVGVVGNAAGAGGSGGWGSRGLSGGGGGNGGDGGGIYNAGTLKVTGSAIHNNNAGTGGQGGGVGSCDCGGYGGGGGGGGVGGSGGGIYNAAAANLTVTGSTIDANQAGSGGGGGPNGFLPPPAASGGHGGDGGGGGGISAASGYLGVTNSTLAGNDAGGGGGGGRGGTYCPIYPGGCHGGAGGSGGAGGAIAASGLTTESLVRNATVADNGTVAGGPGGGGRYPGVGGASGNGGGFADSTALSLQNTIVASNNANGAANCNPSSGVANDGHDLSYGDSSCPGANGNPALQALSDYGGPTETMALAPGSAAIDQVPASGAGCPATDQRGVKRPQGSACDIGAFEFATPHITITAPANGASYMKGSTVLAAYSCSEGGITSPIATCTGTVASGKPIDTSTTGTRHFTVTTTDKAANQTTTTITYKITT